MDPAGPRIVLVHMARTRLRRLPFGALYVSAAAAAAIGVAALALEPGQARACGGFFSPKLGVDRRPSLAYEQVVIVHDAAKNREHFIREVAFRKADLSFGFVVPTPTRPEVAKFDKALFNDLHAELPFDPPTRGLAGVGMIGSGAGSGTGAGFGGGVTVLEQKKVGSFTAFVLEASDSKALSKWLVSHRLGTTPENEAWLAHYVALEFYYVAMRYDPPQGATKDSMQAAMGSEVLRISFDTPVPFYPYLEPALPAGAPAEDRVLDLWVVGSAPVIPVALRDAGGKRTWIRPLRKGEEYTAARPTLDTFGRELGALLPEGQLVVQTFQDQKHSRAGIGDILFVPASKTELGADDRAALAPILAVLDPELAPETEAP